MTYADRTDNAEPASQKAATGCNGTCGSCPVGQASRPISPGGIGSTLTIALAGNPNSGKTTIFNHLTGTRQHVGNYPGVTVERKEGACMYMGRSVKVVDLPGTYSLTAYSIEEIIARQFIVDEKPDVVVHVLDSSNLERNLYLTVQLIELGIPLVLALNMSDMARQQGILIDKEKLSQLLGIPVVATVGHKAQGIAPLLDAIFQVADESTQADPHRVVYGTEIEKAVAELAGIIEDEPALVHIQSPRWIALKLLENDRDVHQQVLARSKQANRIMETCEKVSIHLRHMYNEEPEITIADQRYGVVSGACQESTRRTVEARRSNTDNIDAILANRVLGLPIFAGLLWLVFEMVFAVGNPLADIISRGFDMLGDGLRGILPDGLIQSLIVDGIIGGVGGVLVFLPNIALLFLAIALLEDTGYMARAAFIMDRIMHKVGLHGKSFIPLLIGFGCNVPALMATRTLESSRDRLATMLITPLMSCGARLPVYVLLTGAFFPAHVHGKVIFSLYVLGVTLGMALALLFRKTILRGQTTPFVMELPPYRMPTLRGLATHMWERCWLYVKKAGTIILGISIIIWACSTFPQLPRAQQEQFDQQIAAAGDNTEQITRIDHQRTEAELKHSIAGRLGSALTPVLEPIGLGYWKIGTSLVAGFAAKEVVVSTTGILYSIGETDEGDDRLLGALKRDPHFSPLVAYTMMVFVLLSLPCLATMAVFKREANSWLWTIFMIVYTTTVAWVCSFIVYNGGRLLGLGT